MADNAGIGAATSDLSDMPIAPDAPAASAEAVARLVDALAGVLSCSREVIELAVDTFAAGGHLLLEDVPGVGKTTLARALSLAIGGSSRRIQFTPDMLPSDLTGVSIYEQSTGAYRVAGEPTGTPNGGVATSAFWGADPKAVKRPQC